MDISPAIPAARAPDGTTYTHLDRFPGDASSRRMHISATLVLPEPAGILTILDAPGSRRPLSTAYLWDGHTSEIERLDGGLGPRPLASSIRYRLHAKCLPLESPSTDHVDLDAIGIASARRPRASANSPSCPDSKNTASALASHADAMPGLSLSPVRKNSPSEESDEAAAARPSACGRSSTFS